ncbi:MAG: hypothetical protein ABIC04_03950 [Nanoarchaeota archaeon]
MSKLAFGVSIKEWIRHNLAKSYVHPLDFVHNFVSRLYAPGQDVAIQINSDKLCVSSPGTIDDRLFLDVEEENLGLLEVIPPDIQFETLSLKSADKSLFVGADRKTEVKINEEPIEGTILQVDGTFDGKDRRRIRQIYTYSDLAVTLNEHVLWDTRDKFEFSLNGFKGELLYDPYSRGSIDFFEKGRYISSSPGIAGITMRLYNHNFPATITRSKIITTGAGKGELDRLRNVIPQLMTDFLKSDYAENLRKESERSYQILLQKVYDKFQHVKDIQTIFERYHVDNCDNNGHSNGSPLGDVNEGKKKKSGIFTKVACYASLCGLLVGFGITANKYYTMTAELKSGTAIVDTRLGKNNPFLRNDDDVLPGMSYISQGDLADLVTQAFDKSLKGYIRTESRNHLFLDKGDLKWGNSEPLDKFHTSIQIPLPDDLIGHINSSRKDMFDAVYKHIKRNYKYGSISPENAKHYTNMVDAILQERKIYCMSAQGLAAIYLHQLGEENIRIAVGAHSGSPHAWLEYKDDGKYLVADFTPPNIDDNFLLQASIGYIKNLPAITAQAIRQTVKDLTQKEKQDRAQPGIFRDPIAGIQGGLALYGYYLIGASALVLAASGAYAGGRRILRAGAGIVRRRVHYRGHEAIFSSASDPDAMKVSELITFPVSYAGERGIRYSQGGIIVSADYRAESPLVVASNAAIHFTDKRQLDIYRRIARSAK